MISIEERLMAVVGGAATTAGMLACLHIGGNRLAWKHASQMKQESAEKNPVLHLTPWINVPLRPPTLLSASLIASLMVKAAAYPNHKPISEMIKFMSPTTLWQSGIALFAVAAYQHYLTIKYLVKIGNPVPHGYEVKTLCTHGPFEFFKHPMYCAMLGCSIATALTNDSVWSLVPSAVFGLYLWGYVIPREERYMTDKFGSSYHNKEYSLRNLFTGIFRI